MSVEISWEPFGIYRRFYAQVEPADLITAIQTLHEDERFEQCLYSINDFRDVTSINVQMSDILKLSMQTLADSKRNPNLRVAVVTQNPDVRKLAEFYISPNYNPYPAKIFATLTEAREWVGADVSPYL